MSLWRRYWYVACESRELGRDRALARSILGEWVAVFRGPDGKPTALQDRCLHRSSQISRGAVEGGELRCPYHGWTYGADGSVLRVPSEGPGRPARARCATRYEALEQDGYVYVRLEPSDERPFKMRRFGEKGFRTIRLQNRFKGGVTDCAENFVDVPHTVFVHPRIFRDSAAERIEATVSRAEGSVRVEYRGERANFGIFSKFLNPKGDLIEHVDEFFAPNVTCVTYRFPPDKTFLITSQSVPVDDGETLVYTDLTYDYGLWNRLAAPVIRRQAQKIIDQDMEVLENQSKTMRKYGRRFQNSAADVVHSYIESLQHELENGRDPRALGPRKTEIEFWA